jgi:murein DD-endopeptidase MepM/ murein hydrolase activator NlpD
VLESYLSVGGRSLTAFRFSPAEGRAGFYDKKGVSLRQAFLRTPLEFRRISSTFSRARRHPVLGRVRKHEGTDYAANTGTPVRAVSDAVVLRAGRAGGYGNLVELRHRNGITTRYAHLSRFAKGVRKGARVSMGQVVGYVGSTGLASGPHLHYEFRINGVAKDSRKVKLPGGHPLGGRDLRAFESERERLEQQLYGTPGSETAPADGQLVAMN